jgi:hypothetical protein
VQVMLKKSRGPDYLVLLLLIAAGVLVLSAAVSDENIVFRAVRVGSCLMTFAAIVLAMALVIKSGEQ